MLENLPDFDLEELVIIYLQVQGNYYVLSNSIAKGSTTIKIECELMSRDINRKEKAVVQVKGGKKKELDAQDFETYIQDGYKVYLYAPRVKNINKNNNYIQITKEELLEFYDKFKEILPESITKWEKLFE